MRFLPSFLSRPSGSPHTIDGMDIIFGKRSGGFFAPPEVSLPREEMQVVLEERFQSALSAIAGGKIEVGERMPVTIQLIREPGNPDDANAVQCVVEGRVVGYVNPTDAARLQKLLLRGERKGRIASLDGYVVRGELNEESAGDAGYYVLIT